MTYFLLVYHFFDFIAVILLFVCVLIWINVLISVGQSWFSTSGWQVCITMDFISFVCYLVVQLLCSWELWKFLNKALHLSLTIFPHLLHTSLVTDLSLSMLSKILFYVSCGATVSKLTSATSRGSFGSTFVSDVFFNFSG